MAVLRVAHVWGDRLLDVRHLAGAGALGPLSVVEDRITIAGEEVVLARGAQLDVPFGATTLRLKYVEPEPRVAAIPDDTDWNFAKLIACLLMLSAAIVAMFIIQVDLGLIQDDSALSRLSARVLKFDMTPPPPKKILELEASATAKVTELNPASAKGRKADKPLEVKSAGLLGALDELEDLDALLAPGLNPSLNNAMNNLKGDRTVSDRQGFDLGPRNGGPGPGTIGLGLDGPGFSRRPSGGPPGGGLTRKISTGPCCAETKVSDGLSKDVIAKVIKRHFAEIKFCYEQSLQQKPELAGKVLVLFVIDGTGAVSEANVAEATLDDPNVEACVLSRIRRWKFPEPLGGGIVSVTHPWFFKPAGTED